MAVKMKQTNRRKEREDMKTVLAMVLMLVFGLLLLPQAFAQQMSTTEYQLYHKVGAGTSGNFKNATVVSCDAKRNTCTVKGQKGNTETGNMTYAGYNGGFNAAKELQPGDKISGQWTKVDGQLFATIVVKEEG
jgi:hypothetical protein